MKSKKKEDSKDKSDKKAMQKPKKDGKGKGKTAMTKIKCYNCRENGHSDRDCPNPQKNSNLARENEQNRKFAELMDLCNNSVCEECAMICTDAYSDEEYEEMVTSKKFDEETYGDSMNTDSDEEQVIKDNVALCAHDSENQLSLINKETDTAQGPTSLDDEIESQKAWTMRMPTIDGDISTMDSEELE